LNLQINIIMPESTLPMPNENKLQQGQLVAECDHCGSGASSGDGDVLRCECGSLIARFVDGQVELKCRRCKRTITLPIGKASESGMG
jgi:hypothetical protein